MHINELSLLHLFSYLDGPTTGPRAFSGTIGKALQTCDKNPGVRLEPIEAREPLRSIHVADLSTDKKYLCAVCRAVTSGQFHNDIEQKNSGNICQSRWLTFANRVLRPFENLKTLADFIVNVYLSTWFDVKCQPKCINVSIHLWNMIRRMQHLSETLQKEVLELIVKRGAYFAHQEKVLIAMISDNNVTIRELGFWQILKARQESEETSRHPSIIRQFKVPEINIKAENYTELLHWESDHQPTEPPITIAI